MEEVGNNSMDKVLEGLSWSPSTFKKLGMTDCFHNPSTREKNTDRSPKLTD